MLNNLIIFFVQTVLNIISFALLLRFVLQWMQVPFQNPLGQLSMALTDFIVKPTRRWVRHYKRWDLSTLLLAFVAQFLLQWVLRTILNNPVIGYGQLPLVNIFFLSILGIIKIVFDIFFYAIILQAILSWVNPQHPIGYVLETLTRPILRPIQAHLPPIQGFDFSALAALILLQMLNIAIIPSIESLLNSNFY